MDSTLQTTTTSSISEQKYVNLRKRLDQLGYRQTLGIESLPLIEKLFNDLVHTTESLKKTKLEKLEMSKNVDQLNTSLKNSSTVSGADLPPSIQAYKSDNAKLIKENNELHLELIKSKDEFETQLKDLKANLRKIEHENSDLRFLNTQYIHKLRSIEKESKDKSKKILELQEKNFLPVIQTPNASKQSLFRRQRMDIDCMLPEPESSKNKTPAISAPSANDPYVIDMIKLADERMAQMQADLEASKQAQEVLENKVASYKSQVENRDREVERLNRLLDGGRSCDIVTLEANLRNNEKLIAHQNFQIEILQEKNHQLEMRVQELMNTKREVINEKHKNEDLQRDLKEFNRMAKKAEMEKQLVVNAADRELDQAKYEINSLDSAMKQLELQKRTLCDELNSLKLELENKDCEITRLRDIVEKIQDDKSKLSKKITKYLENEKELVQELDYLKNCRRSGSTLTRSNSQKSLTAKLDSHIKNIENERDFFKQEVETLQRLLKASNHEHQIRARSASRHVSPCQNIIATCTTTSPGHRSSFNHKSRRDANIVASRSPSRANRTKSSSPTGLLATAGSRPTSSTRCSVCANKGGSPIRSSVRITTSTSPLRGYNDEVKQLRRERDELQALLDKFERHMAEIQANVKVLTSERDKVAQLYDETREELHNVRKELLKCGKSSNVSLATQAVIKRVETERDTAIYDLRNVCNERDTYKDRLRLTNENAIKEKLCLEQQIEDLQSCLRNSDMEKKEICQQVNSLQNQLEDLESKYHAQNYQLAQVNQELNEQKSAANQLRILAEESDRALEEQRRQFVMKVEELHKAVQENYRLEQKLADMQEINRVCKDDINNLKMTVNALDKDKDKLLANVDEKAVENLTLKQELAMKHRRIDELNNQLSQLDAALDRANDELKCKLKDITSLRIQVDRANEEIADLSRKLDSNIRENKRLQDDLITATRENQVLHSELEKCNGDKDHLKEQLQDYINEVTKFEELVNQKEKDRSSILEQYRDTSNELNNIKISLNSLENEASNLKIELQMKHADNKRLREKIESLEKQTHHQMSINQELEVKLSGANRNAQRLEEALRDSQKENQEMLQDVLHLRELNSRLDQCKEDLSRQLNSKELDLEQMQNDLNDKRAETELLKSHIHSERTMVKNLEELIASNREKDFQNQLSNQERDAEIQLLKDRIQLNDQNLQSRNKEVSTLRTKLVEYEGEIERLRRQLTNERFERERAAQELRKLNDCELASARYIRSKSPIRTITIPGCSSSGGSSAAAVAAAAAAVAASNAAAIASGYRSHSPARSLSPCKEHGIHITSSSSSNSLRYSSSERRNSSPCRAIDERNKYIY